MYLINALILVLNAVRIGFVVYFFALCERGEFQRMAFFWQVGFVAAVFTVVIVCSLILLTAHDVKAEALKDQRRS